MIEIGIPPKIGIIQGILRQVSGMKYLNQISTNHLACGDSEIT